MYSNNLTKCVPIRIDYYSIDFVIKYMKFFRLQESLNKVFFVNLDFPTKYELHRKNLK
jgi:hypothetical protein